MPKLTLYMEADNSLQKIDMATYSAAPHRYELRSGTEADAPLCPYGNHYEWIGYDKVSQEYVRFTKSVFKKLVQAFNT